MLIQTQLVQVKIRITNVFQEVKVHQIVIDPHLGIKGAHDIPQVTKMTIIVIQEKNHIPNFVPKQNIQSIKDRNIPNIRHKMMIINNNRKEYSRCNSINIINH